MGRLSCCLAFILSSDNYNVNDWVLKETLLGCILKSACAAWCTGESAQTLSQFLISSVRKNIGPCYTALSQSLIIIFVRAAYSQPHQFPQIVNFTVLSYPPVVSLWYHLYCCWQAQETLFFFFFFAHLTPPFSVSWLWCYQMLSQPISLIPSKDQIITKQRVLACPVECPCKCFTAVDPFCQTVKWLIVKVSQRGWLEPKGRGGGNVVKQLSISDC